MSRCAARLLRLACVPLVVAIISGCQFRFAPARQPVRPTPTTAENSPAVQPQQPASGPAATASEPPLRFTFPTPGPAPISLWRPPLYDTPWALGPYDHFYFNRPIAADEVNWPLADYRYGGTFFGSNIVHTGIDIPAPRNTPVLAAANGRVISAGYGLFSGKDDPNDPYGQAVVIRHDFGYQEQRLYTVYAHMDKIIAVEGQEVKTGDVLGLVGTTGMTTGPHLHFEVRMERNSYFTTFNPELWLAPPQGWGVLAGHLENTNTSLLTQQDVHVRNKETGQKWVVRTYGDQAVNSDPHYDENLVLSDLPAGNYEITIDYDEKRYVQDLEIHPGAVSYFRFRGKLYFDTSQPPAPTIDDLLGTKAP